MYPVVSNENQLCRLWYRKLLYYGKFNSFLQSNNNVGFYMVVLSGLMPVWTISRKQQFHFPDFVSDTNCSELPRNYHCKLQ